MAKSGTTVNALSCAQLTDENTTKKRSRLQQVPSKAAVCIHAHTYAWPRRGLEYADETFHLEPSQQRSTTTASARSTTYPYSNALP